MRHTKHATNGITQQQRDRLKRVASYRGLFTRVAETLKLGPNGRSHVRRVALGERQSRRVEAALRVALEELEKEAA
jgi:hypothetical protein